MGEKERLMLTSLLIAVVIVSMPIAAVLVATRVISNVGRIVIVTPPPPPEIKLNIYVDENCTIVLTEIDWGKLEPGETKNLTAYVENLGDVPFTILLSTENWVPVDAATYIALSWDYANQTVSVGEVLPVIFTLTVDSGASEGNFSFDIVITATEA